MPQRLSNRPVGLCCTSELEKATKESKHTSEPTHHNTHTYHLYHPCVSLYPIALSPIQPPIPPIAPVSLPPGVQRAKEPHKVRGDSVEELGLHVQMFAGLEVPTYASGDAKIWMAFIGGRVLQETPVCL